MKRILFVAALAVASSAASAQAQAVDVTLSQWKVTMAKDTLPAGNVTFNIKNVGEMTHAIYVRGEGIAKGSKEISAGQSATFTLALKPGTYEVYCPLSDLSHRMAGMTRKIVVVAAPAATKKP